MMDAKLFLRLAYLLLSLCGSASAETVLLDFTASWCGPCQRMTPLVEQLQQEGYSVRKIDVDANPEAAEKYNVTGVPCFVFLEDGKVTGRIVGEASIDSLRRKLKPQVKQELAPVKLAPKVHPAVVRVVGHEGGGAQAGGSGTLVVANETSGVIITNHHVVNGCRGFEVRFPDGKKYPAKLVAVDRVNDLAALEIAKPHVEPAALAERDAPIGSDVIAAGYGRFVDRFAYQPGTITGTSTDMTRQARWIDITSASRQGDSGGPIFDTAYRLVGVRWGGGRNSTPDAHGRTQGTAAVTLSCIRGFLRRLPPRCQPCKPQGRQTQPRAQTPDEGGPFVGPVEPEQPAIPPVATKPKCECPDCDCAPCRCDNEKLLAEINSLKAQLVAISNRKCEVPEAKPFTFVLKQDGKVKGKKLVKPGDTVGINVVTKKVK